MKACANLNEQTKLNLLERVKELSCLYRIAHLAANAGTALGKVLEGITGILPSAWLYPDIACARIVLDGHSRSAKEYPKRVRHRQRTPIVIHNKRRGYVEISYVEEKPERDEGPFLNEERALLDAVANEIAVIIMRREAEQEKLNLEEQLRHADRLATIGQLAAGVAHELNEPLNHILGFAQLIKKSPGLPDQVQADVDKIVNSSFHAREIVRKLLVFSRQVSPQKTKVDLNYIVKNAIGLFESKCASDGIEFQCVLQPDLPKIDADPSQLHQVFVNLIVNAIQAMSKGGKITISTLKDHAKACILVEDTGAGMGKNVLQKIFTPFFTTKDIGTGTGLGLPVVHGIVTAHGGSIKVASKVGKGTKCRIELPLRKEDHPDR